MAISDDRCLKSLRDAGMEAGDAEEHLSDVQERIENYKKAGFSDTDAIGKATEDALKEKSAVVQRERLNALMNLHKRMDNWTGFQNNVHNIEEITGKENTAENWYQSLRAMLVGVNRSIPYARVSLDADMSATRAKISGGFMKELGDSKLTKIAQSGKMDQDIAKEIINPGSTKNSIASKLAEIYKKYGELSKNSVNNEGAWISDLKDYIARNEHSWEKINNAGFDTWKADVLNTLDKGKTFSGMDKPRIERFLQNTYNALVSGEFFVGGKIGMKDPAFTGPANIAKRYSQERVLHFTDDGWYQYWQKYGTSNSLAQSIENTIGRGAKDSSLMRWFGTNPEAEFKNFLTRIRQEYSATSPEEVRKFQDTYERKLQNRFDELSGRGNTPGNQLASSIGTAARTFENIVHLGFVPFAHVNVAVTRALNAHQWGDSALGAIADTLKATLTGGHAATEEGREMLDLIGARNNGFIAHTAGIYNEGFTGMAATLNNLETKMSGLQYLMNTNRRSDEWMLSRFLGRNMDKDFLNLPERTQKTLETYGITKTEWQLLREAKDPHQLEGQTFLTPDLARRTTADSKVQEDLERTLYSMFADSSRRAMNIPGSEVKALLYRDLPFGGPLGKAVMQFKQWPTELMLNAFGRTIYDNPTTQQKMLSTFLLAGGLTVAGYIRMALRNVANGQEPPSLHGGTILEAAQEGGAGMMIADTFSAMLRQHKYDEAVASLTGPVGKDVYDMGKIAWDAGHGKGQMRAVEEFGLKHIPFQNLWEIKTLTNYYFLWGLHEAVHPGWSQRYNNYIEQDTGHKPFIAPHP